jgi:hypothetical protein
VSRPDLSEPGFLSSPRLMPRWTRVPPKASLGQSRALKGRATSTLLPLFRASARTASTRAPVPFRLAPGTRIGRAGRRAASGGIHGGALAGCRTVASASRNLAASTRRSVLARNFT